MSELFYAILGAFNGFRCAAPKYTLDSILKMSRLGIMAVPLPIWDTPF